MHNQHEVAFHNRARKARSPIFYRQQCGPSYADDKHNEQVSKALIRPARKRSSERLYTGGVCSHRSPLFRPLSGPWLVGTGRRAWLNRSLSYYPRPATSRVREDNRPRFRPVALGPRPFRRAIRLSVVREPASHTEVPVPGYPRGSENANCSETGSMALAIKKVLISDSVDASAVKILESHGVQVTLKTDYTKPELLQAIQSLKVIGRAGTGVDNIDCDAATRQGILVINAPGGNTLSAAELTCAMIVTLSREIPAATMSLKGGKWDRKVFMGNELYGKTLAIIGLGRIGKEVATRMQSFGMKTIGFDPIVPKEVSREFGVESMSLDEIWPQADYITVHTPLIPQTKDLIGKASLQKCKKGVRVINVARGGIVNEDDLLAALESGHCGGAGLDVFIEARTPPFYLPAKKNRQGKLGAVELTSSAWSSPWKAIDSAVHVLDVILTLIPAMEPPKNTKLIGHPKVICTPHLGANTKEAQLRVAQEIAEQFVALSKGLAVPGVVNAPSLAQTQVPENKPWADLGIALGKIAAALAGSLSSGLQVEVTTKGAELEKKGQFLSSAACIGLLNQFGQSHANFINVTVLASDAGVKASHKHAAQAVYSKAELVVTVKSGSASHSVVGTVSGPTLLLCSLDDAAFQPLQLLSPGGLLLGTGEDSPNTLAQVIGGLVNSGVSVLSASRTAGHAGKAFYLFTTGSPVKAQTQPPIAPLKFWTYVTI
ncbi:hypothetical protein HPB48_020545 [Haemaphysalis longicornis]|uniref:D-3-phosphoglycerate dehydrogenase n=1 Tax=Haemaphysalis longicornis TaxID=44386 RepID=A0A9J6G6F5_HAELO|nr:hypothetical protein HPB48_020545 [Haemaphysalis longicornis]